MPSWPTTCTREAAGEAGRPFSRAERRREKKKPRRVGDPPLSFGKVIRAHPQSCFVCYGQSSAFQHDHRPCPIHRAVAEAYKKAQETKKRTSANIREAKEEVSKDDLSKLLMVGTQLAKEVQEIKRAWGPRRDKDKDRVKDKKGTCRWGKKGDAVNEVAAEQDTPTTDAPQRSPCSRAPPLVRSQDGAAINDAPPTSEILDFPGYTPSGRPETRPEGKHSRSGRVRAKAGGLTALRGPTCTTKVPGEGSNPCTQ